MSAALAARRGTVAKSTSAALTYAQTILAESELVSFWKLLETSGTNAADSKGSHVGVYTGSPTLNQTPLVTGGDKAVLFSGSGQYVDIAGSAALQPASISCECWVKPTSLAADKVVMSIADGCFGITWLASGAHASAFFWNGATNRVITGATTLVAGTIYMLAATFDDATGTVKLYVNGVEDATQTFAAEHIGWDATTTSQIASGLGGATPMNAVGDDAAVYNAALPAATLLSHYNKGLSG